MDKIISLAQSNSQYLARWFTARPDWQDWVVTKQSKPLNAQELENIVQEVQASSLSGDFDEVILMRALREIRQKTMLWIGVRDLTNQASLDEVTEVMTHLAELSLELAMTCLSKELGATHGFPQYPDGRLMPLWIVGMGKLGGRELNVSSDIDLIFVYEDDGETLGGAKSLSHHEWFARLGKKLIKVLSELTEDGFVFRVDMRLRPNGDSGPLVCSLNMLEEYFMIQGREWERYAWIKGRLVYPLREAGESGLPTVFNNVVRPFVYRRYLDFGVIAAIRELHAQIRHEANLRATSFPERAADLKLGRGGIREIEFLAQMFQLIRGGREPALRERPTMTILKTLVDLGLMDHQLSKELQDAYIFLRRAEHRVQWWDDAQIHYLPTAVGAQDRIAHSLGFSSRDEFYTELGRHQAIVIGAFSSAFVLDGNHANAGEMTSWVLPESVSDSLRIKWESLQGSGRYRAMSDISKKNLTAIFKSAIELDPQGGEPTLVELLNFLETISRRASYLSLLTEYPHAVEQVIQLIEASKWGITYLNRHPHLLDEMLISHDKFTPESDPKLYWDNWRKNLQRRLNDLSANDNPQELMMDALRDAHHAEIFQILLADLGIGRTQALPVEAVSDRLSALADVILEETLSRIWQELANKYGFNGDFSKSGFGVIAYGKLGGKELGYGSDLDLVFIYDETFSPLDKEVIAERYAMLVRRLIMWLTSATSAGILFDIDTRLRPNGAAGLMVSSVEAFESYQLSRGENTAWVWEHQALSRARFCAGDLRVGESFDAIRARVLSQVRDELELRKEILEMRQRIHDGHPNLTGQFDLKHDAGGMVDIEFMVQFLVLANAHQFPALLGNVGNIALLRIAGESELIPKELSLEVAHAYRLLRQLQHRVRLDGADKSRIHQDNMTPELEAARNVVQALWALVMEN